ncbi:MAG: hypothetical protein OCD02_04590 [Spirochaetaceae bacterium]
MDRRLNQIYDDHKDHSITFNQSVIKELGLRPADITLKCSGMKLSCIIYSSSLSGAKILINLSIDQLNYIKRKQQKISIMFSFNDKYEHKEICFYIHSKISEITEYNQEKKDLYFFLVDFSKRVPDDFINILGSHIIKQLNLHKRAEERFILNKDLYSSSKSKNHQNFLFVSGCGKRCILTELSMFSAKVILVGCTSKILRNSSAMLIMKYKGLEGIGEMIGHIERIEVVNEDESLLSIIIKFDQEVIPPAYKMWISEYLELVNVRKI